MFLSFSVCPTALNSTYLECAGDPSEEYYKDFSLVITRDSIYEDTGRLTYIPARMLQGTCPFLLDLSLHATPDPPPTLLTLHPPPRNSHSLFPGDDRAHADMSVETVSFLAKRRRFVVSFHASFGKQCIHYSLHPPRDFEA